MYKEPFVHQIYIGKKEQINRDSKSTESFDTSISTAIYKKNFESNIWLGKQGLDGDEESSEDKALYTYPIKHYAFWKNILNLQKINYGSMGENLSVLEMDEYSVCIGDTYQFGDAVIQVSQPHLPHWEISYRFKNPNLASVMQEHGHTGWYFRVLKEGKVFPRLDLELIDRPFPLRTIAACNEIMHEDTTDFKSLDELASCEALSVNWRKILQARLRGQTFSDDKRLFGPYKNKDK